jgi:hypothetical protein
VLTVKAESDEIRILATARHTAQEYIITHYTHLARRRSIQPWAKMHMPQQDSMLRRSADERAFRRATRQRCSRHSGGPVPLRYVQDTKLAIQAGDLSAGLVEGEELASNILHPNSLPSRNVSTAE